MPELQVELGNEGQGLMRTLLVHQLPNVLDRLVLVDGVGGIWLTCAAPLWNLRAWIGFWLQRGERARVKFHKPDPQQWQFPYVYASAVRIAERWQDTVSEQ